MGNDVFWVNKVTLRESLFWGPKRLLGVYWVTAQMNFLYLLSSSNFRYRITAAEQSETSANSFHPTATF